MIIKESILSIENYVQAKPSDLYVLNQKEVYLSLDLLQVTSPSFKNGFEDSQWGNILNDKLSSIVGMLTLVERFLIIFMDKQFLKVICPFFPLSYYSQ